MFKEGYLKPFKELDIKNSFFKQWLVSTYSRGASRKLNKNGLFLPNLVILVESCNKNGLFLPVLVILVQSLDNVDECCTECAPEMVLNATGIVGTVICLETYTFHFTSLLF